MSNVINLWEPKSEIKMFFHCARCLEEIPEDIAPKDWVRIEAGWTTQGFQIWCARHDINIIHMDFEGQKHPVTE